MASIAPHRGSLSFATRPLDACSRQLGPLRRCRAVRPTATAASALAFPKTAAAAEIAVLDACESADVAAHGTQVASRIGLIAPAAEVPAPPGVLGEASAPALLVAGMAAAAAAAVAYSLVARAMAAADSAVLLRSKPLWDLARRLFAACLRWLQRCAASFHRSATALLAAASAALGLPALGSAAAPAAAHSSAALQASRAAKPSIFSDLIATRVSTAGAAKRVGGRMATPAGVAITQCTSGEVLFAFPPLAEGKPKKLRAVERIMEWDAADEVCGSRMCTQQRIVSGHSRTSPCISSRLPMLVWRAESAAASAVQHTAYVLASADDVIADSRAFLEQSAAEHNGQAYEIGHALGDAAVLDDAAVVEEPAPVMCQ